MSGWFTLFTNCRYILNGELVEDHLVISDETGFILRREGYIGGEAIDLEDAIIAPGFLELHTNGANGFHFTHFEDEHSYARKVDVVARYYATQGVTGFWATIPTVKGEQFQKVSTYPVQPLLPAPFCNIKSGMVLRWPTELLVRRPTFGIHKTQQDDLFFLHQNAYRYFITLQTLDS
jgi:hypothetical protein